MTTPASTSRRALVVLSGGQDSTYCLFAAVREFGVDNVAAVTFDYNQRHRREIDAARDVARLAGVDRRHTVVTVGPILGGTSPLTSNTPLEQYADYTAMVQAVGTRVEATFVPMRNALFLTLAANRAVVTGATHIFTGVCQQDGANYPDCTASFIRAQERAINAALGTQDQPSGYIFVITPLMTKTKADAITRSRTMLGVNGVSAYEAYAFTHTAYDGQFPPTGHDHATLLRAQAFEEANVPDPLVLRAFRMGGMDYPTTPNYQPDTWSLMPNEALNLVRWIQQESQYIHNEPMVNPWSDFVSMLVDLAAEATP